VTSHRPRLRVSCRIAGGRRCPVPDSCHGVHHGTVVLGTLLGRGQGKNVRIAGHLPALQAD
jgi:hypothetical protein